VVVGAVRRFLLWALERWTGDRYLRAALLEDAAVTFGAVAAAGSATAALVTIDIAVKYARAHERDR
jgi:hypothetical protein